MVSQVDREIQYADRVFIQTGLQLRREYKKFVFLCRKDRGC